MGIAYADASTAWMPLAARQRLRGPNVKNKKPNIDQKINLSLRFPRIYPLVSRET